MDANYNRFQDRLRRIEQPRAQGGRDVVVRPDGLVVPRRRRVHLSMPWRSVTLAVICCLLLKGVMIWHQGAPGYGARLEELRSNGAGHRVAAWVLAMDPVSVAIGAALTRMIGRPPT